MTVRQVLAWGLAAGLCACRAPDAPAPAPVRAPAAVEIPSAEPAPSGEAPPARPAPTLARADCAALREARALAVAVVVESKSDCSGVGHQRVVLEVRELARGDGIERVVTSRPLSSSLGPAFRLGDTFVIGIEPGTRPAETVYCVALPAHQGTVRHALEVDSTDEARAILDELAAGGPCAR